MKAIVLSAALLALPATAEAESWTATTSGVEVHPAQGSEAAVRLAVYGPRAIRVTSVPKRASLNLPASLMVVAQPEIGGFSVRQDDRDVVLTTGQMTARVALSDGDVRFFDAAGKPILTESGPPAFTAHKVEGQTFVSVAQRFNEGTDEGFYGLGQHQNRQMDYNGEDVDLAQHNMDIAVPFVVSTRNYGVLWDNTSITRFGDPRPEEFAGQSIGVTGDGGKPGFTARYYLGDELRVTRQEPTIDYQYIADQAKWPAAAKAEGDTVQSQRVVWSGTLHPDASGTHKFRLYSSSYAKVFVDGREVLSRWRQNWNPWYHDFEMPLKKGKPVDLRVEWRPNAGYIALFHHDPLPAAERHSLSFASDDGRGLDYYVVTGDDADGVIAGYRMLTGKAPLMPQWAYGFWQSRQRYETQDQLTGVLEEYRKRGLPIDNVVQDWFYWPEDKWGCQCFDPERFPDPQGMVDKVHALHGHVMISVWPKFYPTTANGKELAAKGYLYQRPLDAGQKDWVGPGYANTYYDAYSPEARSIYFRQIREGLVSKGFDAWWMDATEPDWHSNLSVAMRAYQMYSPAAGLPGAAIFNSYPLVHALGMAEGLRAAQPDKRPFILTRSGFGGTQRASAAVWSGDVAARWSNLRDQISAGVNLSLSGIPNWTQDIGGFAVEDRYSKQDPAAQNEWRELQVRWFQFGAFSPLFRSHGEFPRREIYELGKDDPATYAALADYDRQRYRLLPYIYTLAADTYFRDGTIMRGLVMDFAADKRTWRIDDEYMFGPAFLVAPVTEYKARSRSVYLPAGASWYEWKSGALHQGGQAIDAAAPFADMPLFVRAGSIVPTGPVRQFTADKPDAPVTLLIYPGAKGQFSLYEDDGTSQAYLKGAWSRIPLAWDDAARSLTIGMREGSFPGMQQNRKFLIRWMRPGRVLDWDAPPDATVDYDGAAQRIAMAH